MKWWKLLLLIWIFGMCLNFSFLFSKTTEQKQLSRPVIINSEFKAPEESTNNLRVATFNLWNYQSDWKTRFGLFADLIAEENIDVIAFQELRVDSFDSDADQFAFIKSLLVQYPHNIFTPASQISNHIKEGIAIFSKKPITSTSTKSLSLFQQETDLNQRVVLQATIEVSPSYSLNVFAAHFSYADVTQCRHALEIVEFMHTFAQSLPQLLLGDLNIYIDFEYPLHLFTGVPIDSTSRCLSVWQQRTNYSQIINEPWWNDRRQFRDVWKTLHPDEKGFTFLSNTPGLDSCRPDRILIGSEEVREENVRIVDTKNSSLQLSDHHGLIADFSLRSK